MVRSCVLLTALAVLLSAAPCRSAEEPPGGPAGCSMWPRNLDKDCVGFAVLFQMLAGEGRTRVCQSPPSAEQVARQMWDCFTGRALPDACTFCDKVIVDGQSVGLTSARGVAAVTAALQARYSNSCLAWSRLNRRRARATANNAK